MSPTHISITISHIPKSKSKSTCREETHVVNPWFRLGFLLSVKAAVTGERSAEPIVDTDTAPGDIPDISALFIFVFIFIFILAVLLLVFSEPEPEPVVGL